MLHSLVMSTVHHSLIFIVPGEESADFDKSSEQAHESKGLSAEGSSSSLAVLEGENGCLWLQMLFFPSMLAGTCLMCLGVISQVCYLLCQRTFTCNGKHRPYWRESVSLHVQLNSVKQMHYWVCIHPAKCIQVDDIHLSVLYFAWLDFGWESSKISCLLLFVVWSQWIVFNTPTSAALLPHVTSALLISESINAAGWVGFKYYWGKAYFNYANHHPCGTALICY